MEPLEQAPGDAATGGERDGDQRWNYALHLLGGGFLFIALQFGNTRLVVPWIAHHLGVAYFVVALLVPALQLGLIGAQLGVSPLISTLRAAQAPGRGVRPGPRGSAAGDHRRRHRPAAGPRRRGPAALRHRLRRQPRRLQRRLRRPPRQDRGAAAPRVAGRLSRGPGWRPHAAALARRPDAAAAGRRQPRDAPVAGRRRLDRRRPGLRGAQGGAEHAHRPADHARGAAPRLRLDRRPSVASSPADRQRAPLERHAGDPVLRHPCRDLARPDRPEPHPVRGRDRHRPDLQRRAVGRLVRSRPHGRRCAPGAPRRRAQPGHRRRRAVASSRTSTPSCSFCSRSASRA